MMRPLAVCLALALGVAEPLRAQSQRSPGAELIHFTSDGTAGSPPLLPAFRHDSVWSAIGTASDGNVYVAVSNHLQPGGNVALFRFEPEAHRMTSLGDIRSISSAVGNWMAAESQYKVHTFLQQHADGRIYLASMDHAPTPFLRGAHVYTIDPATGTVTDFSKTQPFLMKKDLTVIPNTQMAAERSGVFIEEYGLKGIALNPRVPDVLYAMTYPDGHLIRYELSTGAMDAVGQSTAVSYVFYVDNRGDAYYAAPAGEGLQILRYDAKSETTVVVASSLPGIGIGAMAPTADGETVYVLEAATKRVYRMNCVTGSFDYLATCCGSNWWRLYNLALSPNGRTLYYVSNHNARSTIRAIDVATGACSEVLDVDALLGTRNLCFGGVNAWDANGDLYAPVWTFAAAEPDLALLRIEFGEFALVGASTTR